MKHKRWRLLAVCLCLFCSCLFSWALPAAAAPTLTTTLTDNAVQRGSKKTFDVWHETAPVTRYGRRCS